MPDCKTCVYYDDGVVCWGEACADKDMYKPKPEPVRYCKYCGGRLSEIRTDGRKSWRHCFSCHFEFEVPADV